MIQLTVLYGQPRDSAAFDHYYQQTHAALVQKIPEIKGYVKTILSQLILSITN